MFSPGLELVIQSSLPEENLTAAHELPSIHDGTIVCVYMGTILNVCLHMWVVCVCTRGYVGNVCMHMWVCEKCVSAHVGMWVMCVHSRF